MPATNKALLRWLPFAAAAVLSIAIACWAPMGRKAFQLDWSLSASALIFSIQKASHIAACAALALLAMLATGRRRWLLALVLPILVGACWELAQTTVVGHAARLADLAPDAAGALMGCAWGVILASLLVPSISERQLRGHSSETHTTES